MDATATMTADAGQAYTELLQRHRGIVYKVAGSYARDPHDRDDLAQEIAAQLWRAWPKYDPARAFSTWMYRIALNVAITHLRGETHRRRHVVAFDEALHDIAGDAADDAASTDGLRMLRRFMVTLEPLDRALLLLYLEERTTRETAEVLGISESNVTTKISRLKQRIRDTTTPSGTI